MRLRQAMASDHQAIIQITSELQGLEADETAEKIKFVKEMEAGLYEIDFLLQQRENERVIQLLDGETVKSLIDTKLAAVMSEFGVGGGRSSADEMNTAAWTEISAQINEGWKDILDAEEKIDAARNDRKEMELLVKELRERFSAENKVRLECTIIYISFVIACILFNTNVSHNIQQNLGQLEIGSLENKWEQKFTEDSNDIMDAENNSTTVNTSRSQVHMELFYDTQEPSYTGQVHDPNGRNNVGFAC